MKKSTKSQELKRFNYHFYCRSCQKTFESDFEPIGLICPFCKSTSVNITDEVNKRVYKYNLSEKGNL